MATEEMKDKDGTYWLFYLSLMESLLVWNMEPA